MQGNLSQRLETVRNSSQTSHITKAHDFTPYELEQREKYLAHCRWIAGWDRAYGIAALDRYAALLPWLRLERKK